MFIWTAQLVPLPFYQRKSTPYSYILHNFSVNIPRCYKDVYVNSFFPRTARLCNSLPIECFPLSYDLRRFKSRINRHLLTVGSFEIDFLYASILLYLFFLQNHASHWLFSLVWSESQLKKTKKNSKKKHINERILICIPLEQQKVFLTILAQFSQT